MRNREMKLKKVFTAHALASHKFRANMRCIEICKLQALRLLLLQGAILQHLTRQQ
jgi:hypothetical protein